jgi:hypothetical protein
MPARLIRNLPQVGRTRTKQPSRDLLSQANVGRKAAADDENSTQRACLGSEGLLRNCKLGLPAEQEELLQLECRRFFSEDTMAKIPEPKECGRGGVG